MKKCPTCGSSYTDQSLNFCLTDGSRLYDESDPDATVVMGAAQRPNTSTPIQSQQTTKPHFIYAGVGLVAVIVVIGAVFLFNRSAAKPDGANQTQTMSPTVAPTVTPTPPPAIETREVWFRRTTCGLTLE
jgi:septal ring-binding cell division protein DamX